MPSTQTSITLQVKIVGYVILAILIFWTFAPLYWMVVTSVKEPNEIYGTSATLFPNKWTWENYDILFNETNFGTYFKNSMLIATTTTFLSLIFASLGGYAIVRLKFTGRRLLARGLVYTYLMPHSMLFIPLLATLITLNLQDTRTGLVLVYLGFTVPFCTWLLMGYFMSIPVELEEAGLVDGCSRLGVLFRIIMPITLPALAVVAFFSFTLSWNEYIYASVLTSSVEVKTIPAGIPNFIIGDVFFWGPMMASTFISSIPPLIVYFLFQRFLITGLTMGAVKG